jgi:hypothetical protein
MLQVPLGKFPEFDVLLAHVAGPLRDASWAREGPEGLERRDALPHGVPVPETTRKEASVGSRETVPTHGGVHNGVDVGGDKVRGLSLVFPPRGVVQAPHVGVNSPRRGAELTDWGRTRIYRSLGDNKYGGEGDARGTRGAQRDQRCAREGEKEKRNRGIVKTEY